MKSGNLKTITDARGKTITYSYNAANQLTHISVPGRAGIQVTYDTCPWGQGKLCQIDDASGATAVSYNAAGDLDGSTRYYLGAAHTVRYAYNLGHRVARLTYPNGYIVDYTRDVKGRITEVRLTRGSEVTVLASNMVYRPDGQIRYMERGHGKLETRTYDLQGRMTRQDIQDTYSQTYTYDANGNVTAGAVDYANSTFPDVTLTGGYDALDRLANETGPTAAAYAYDANGNRLSDGTDSYSYASASNRLTQVDTSAFTYDAAGNLLSDGTRALTYTPQGQVESVTTAQGTTWYVYNLQGQRTRKTLPGGAIILYHYDEAGHLIAETTDTGTPIKSYVWLEDMPLAQIDHSAGSDAIYILHTDHLATPRLATTLPGGTVWRWEGSAFGDIQPIGSVTINLRFPGQYYDAESGLLYNWNRYYDPRLGRYLTSDPIGLAGGPNTYIYGNDNPLRFTDPDGLLGQPSGLVGARQGTKSPGPLRPSPNGNVQVCCRPANIAAGLVDHCWLKTSTITAGMNETAQCTLAGNGASGLPLTPVVVSDHTCDKPTRCEKYDVDEQCVNKELSIGRSLGRFGPTNNCQSFAREVLEKCRKN